MSDEQLPREAPISTTATISAKEEVIEMLRRLPDDLTYQDILYHVYVLEQIKEGLESVQSGPHYSQEEIEAQVKEWLTE